VFLYAELFRKIRRHPGTRRSRSEPSLGQVLGQNSKRCLRDERAARRSDDGEDRIRAPLDAMVDFRSRHHQFTRYRANVIIERPRMPAAESRAAGKMWGRDGGAAPIPSRWIPDRSLRGRLPSGSSKHCQRSRLRFARDHDGQRWRTSVWMAKKARSTAVTTNLRDARRRFNCVFVNSAGETSLTIKLPPANVLGVLVNQGVAIVDWVRPPFTRGRCHRSRCRVFGFR